MLKRKLELQVVEQRSSSDGAGALWSRVRDFFLILSSVAVPILVAVFGSKTASEASTNATKVEYFKLATAILQQPVGPVPEQNGLRELAADIFVATAPIEISKEQKQLLVSKALPKAIFCAEPKLPPAVSQSGLPLQSQQQPALTPRDSTIQLLRDSLYRACEAFANGAIDESGYKAIVEKYQQQMLALIALEQLASPRQKPAP